MEQIAFATMIGNLLLTYGPKLVMEFLTLTQKKDVTLADWTTLFLGLETKEQLFAEAQARVLPPAPPA